VDGSADTNSHAELSRQRAIGGRPTGGCFPQHEPDSNPERRPTQIDRQFAMDRGIIDQARQKPRHIGERSRLRRNSASGKRMLSASSVAECIELNSTATMPFLDIATTKSPSELLPHANRMLSRIAVAF